MTIEKISRKIGNREFTIETGRIAKQAHGAVTVQYGDTVILAAVVSEKEADESKDFFPLTVEYREKAYAAGKIPGGYFKREGRPSERETLVSRLIDRPIRSVFDDDYTNETQVIVTVLSSDRENPADILSMNGASAALMVSDVPFEDALGSVRVGMVNGQLLINPTIAEMETSDLDLVVTGTKDKIVMIEAGANEITEEQMMEALHFGHQAIRELAEMQAELRARAGKKKREIARKEPNSEIESKVAAAIAGEFDKIFGGGSKEDREEGVKKLYKEKVLGAFDTASADFKEGPVKAAFEKFEKKYVRELIVRKGKRPDGRQNREIRNIDIEVGVLPRTHGSSIFTRGQTQALCVTTLGTGDDEQRIDALEGDIAKRFMLHYNFPSFSVGETGRYGSTGRREIGHGALAERALKPIIPTDPDVFPYVVRVVSDIMESNGSSSMASVCGGTLSLMDAGVPIKAPVAGIALGLVTEGADWKVLTDIAGIEDHLGDMDFKAAGTRKGLTALQMDLKISGVTDAILLEAFDQAKEARFKILDKIAAVIGSPRENFSSYAPRIIALQINPEKIGALIGPGGKVIRGICEETGVKIDIDDSGRVLIA
ncbi:MAG: polyribonucleotide nucleotidyltransferase, partial [Candidatus Omnitrophica bacterium]|nr:polyribonucleotide nucleotidyltransferase [Candidatus Omnitrophota bacterium]